MVLAVPPFPTQDAGFGQSPSELGFAAWTQDPATCSPNAGVAGVAGTLQLRRFSVAGIQQITNVFLSVITAAVGATASQCFAGVWDSTGRLIGLTADMSAAIGGTGLLQLPLVAGAGVPGPPYIVNTPFIYVGHWWNAATSGPQLSRSVINDDPNGATGVPASQATSVTANTGLTTIATAPARLGALTKSTTLKNWYAIN